MKWHSILYKENKVVDDLQLLATINGMGGLKAGQNILFQKQAKSYIVRV